MDIQEFGDIVMPRIRVFFSERCSDCCRLLLDQGSFVGDGLCKYELGCGQSRDLTDLAGSDALDEGCGASSVDIPPDFAATHLSDCGKPCPLAVPLVVVAVFSVNALMRRPIRQASRALQA